MLDDPLILLASVLNALPTENLKPGIGGSFPSNTTTEALLHSIEAHGLSSSSNFTHPSTPSFPPATIPSPELSPSSKANGNLPTSLLQFKERSEGKIIPSVSFNMTTLQGLDRNSLKSFLFGPPWIQVPLSDLPPPVFLNGYQKFMNCCVVNSTVVVPDHLPLPLSVQWQ